MFKQKNEIKLHNRFDIEVVDKITGEIKQKAQAENVICTSFWETDPFNTNNNRIRYLHLGKGTGTPSTTDLTLFDYITKISIGNKETIVDEDNKIFSVKILNTLDETILVDETITEVGLGNYNNIFTHAMIKDMNGNPISIIKTATDVIKIYSTLFLYWGDMLSSGIIPYEPSSDYDFFLTFMRLYEHSTYTLRYDRNLMKIYNYNNTLLKTLQSVSWTYSASEKKVTCTAPRISINDANDRGGIQKIRIINTYNYGGGFETTLPAPWYPGSDIIKEEVGIGDGENKDFATFFSQASNVTVYVDDVVDTNIVIDAANSSIDNNIHFTTPPANGAVITVDYHTDVIAKNENNVFDFKIDFYLGDYTPEE